MKESKTFHAEQLRPCLSRWITPSKVTEDKSGIDFNSKKEMETWVKKYFDYIARIECANSHLHERGLIILEKHQHEPNVVSITLTVSGYDLGRKYLGYFSSSGMWFEEYKKHWLWLIVAFIGGVIVTKLIDVILAALTFGTKK
jgi:hypothetical protein